MAKTLIAFGDLHIPDHNPVAVELLCKAVELVKPDILICLGDLLDCNQFSSYPPTFGVEETDYADDVVLACKILDRLQDSCGRLVMIEGNHEQRIARYAANDRKGKGTYTMLAPHIVLPKGRRRCRYVQMGERDFYKITPQLWVTHGWSYAKNAVGIHMDIAQGHSVIFGHTHRCDMRVFPIRATCGASVTAISGGCLCNLRPLYRSGKPVDWVNGFVQGYIGKHSHTLYPATMQDNKRIILTDGTEVATTNNGQNRKGVKESLRKGRT